MLPVPRSPITSQLSISVAFSTGTTKIARLAGLLDDGERVDVASVLDAGGEAPVPGDEVAALGRLGDSGARALPGDHGNALGADEDLLDRFVGEVRGAGPDRQAGGHQHPSGGRVAVRDVGEHLERVDRVELRPAEHLGHPHREQAVVVEGVDDGRRQFTLVVGELGVLVDERHERPRPFGQDGSGGQRCTEFHVVDSSCRSILSVLSASYGRSRGLKQTVRGVVGQLKNSAMVVTASGDSSRTRWPASGNVLTVAFGSSAPQWRCERRRDERVLVAPDHHRGMLTRPSQRGMTRSKGCSQNRSAVVRVSR